MFEWYTSVACGPTAPVQGSGNCTATDNIRGTTYDLSPLQRLGGYNLSVSGFETSINICGTVPCGSYTGVGACELRAPAAAATVTPDPIGMATSTLWYNHGDLWLHYNTTTPCGVEENGASVKQVCDCCSSAEDVNTKLRVLACVSLSSPILRLTIPR
jgi:hypothetical protein